jgi:capsular exopolysaccharide synthesis family protein
MSRVYEALCQAGLEQLLRPRPIGSEIPVPEVPLFDPDELPEQLEDLADRAEAAVPPKSVIPPKPLALDDVGVFNPVTSPESRLVALGDKGELGAEKFRLLRARLQHLKAQKNVKSVLITSALPEDGKSLVALNLAISLAKHTQEKVLIIEGDLHRPVFAGRTGLEGFRGLSEWLTSDRPIEKHMYRMRDYMLWILPAGAPRHDSLGMLQSTKLVELMESFTKTFDWVLIDAPPLLPLADVNFWSQRSDGILLVVREGKTTAKLLKKGLETLDSANVLGVVFNHTNSEDLRYYDRYYRAGRVAPTNGRPHADE